MFTSDMRLALWAAVTATVVVRCTSSCYNAAMESCGDCRPGCEYCGQMPEDGIPIFHLMDRHGCAENDPNGLVFDDEHGIFHHFYQAHLATDGQPGPIWGHLASKDLVSWTSLDAAIWNGLDYVTGSSTIYDTVAIYTGSAAVVDGAGPGGRKGIVQIYPGLCSTQHEWCETGTVLAQAIPTNYSDPLLRNWTKPPYNPIMNSTQRDPSSPWQTPSGEWRITTYNSKIYGTASTEDFLKGRWYEIGTLEALETCECPSLYPIDVGNGNTNMLHVHKMSCDGFDWWQVGNFTPGQPGEVGSFEPASGWEDLFEKRKIDPSSAFYASKDAVYPSIGNSSQPRRVNYGWARVAPVGCQTLPRQIVFNEAARMLEQRPLEEVVFGLRNKVEAANVTTLGSLNLTSGAAQHSEITVRFEHLVGLVGVKIEGCVSCSFNATSNVAACDDVSAELLLLDNETALDLRVFVDATFVEAYFQNGRVAMTVSCATTPLAKSTDVSLFATAEIYQAPSAADGAAHLSAYVYSLRSIWVDPSVVENAPRIYW